MNQRLIVAINREFRILLHSMQWVDLDNFGLRLSSEIANGLSSGCSVQQALSKALKKVHTRFFRVNRINRKSFESKFLMRIRQLGVVLTNRSILELLREFRVYAQRELAQDLKNATDEGKLRAFLQTFLAGKGERGFREVPSGRGKTDILLVGAENEDIIEVKLWRGEEYYREGLEELAEYLRTQNLAKGYYMILDCSLKNKLVDQRGHEWREVIEGKQIDVIIITVSPVPPSKIRKARKRYVS